MSFSTQSVRRSEDQWRSAINRNQAVAKVSNLSGAIQIYKGRYFWPLEPTHPGNDIDIETIGHALAVMPRWGGQTADKDGRPIRYSVAQHSVYVAELCQRSAREIAPEFDWDNLPLPGLYGLLHDSPEGYGFADLVRPVKCQVVGYSEREWKLMSEINRVLRVPINVAIETCVKRVDNMMVFLERDALVGQPVVPYTMEDQHPGCSLRDLFPDFRIWEPEEAKERFIQAYEDLTQ